MVAVSAILDKCLLSNVSGIGRRAGALAHHSAKVTKAINGKTTHNKGYKKDVTRLSTKDMLQGLCMMNLYITYL